MINPETFRRTVDFAKAQGWIKDPPPRNPGELCTGKTAKHHFKDGVCCYCGDRKLDERGKK